MGQRLTGMTSGQKSFPCVAPMFEFKQHGKSGTWVSELLPHTASIVDDICVVKIAQHRGDQPRPGHHVPPDRLPAARPAQHGGVAQLRPGQREPEPARLRRADLPGQRQQGRPADLLAPVGQRLPAQPAPGRAPPLRRRPGALPLQPARHRRRRPAGPMLDAEAKLNHMAEQAFGDPEINTRIAQYEMAYRMQSSVPELTDLSNESKATLDAVRPGRHRQQRHRRRLRPQLPARPPDGRARRAVRPAHAPRLGPAQRPAPPDPRPVQGRRPAHRRPGQGPQAARPARRHAGHLGRRVRPDHLQPGRADQRPTTAATTTAAASPCGWPAAASRPASSYGETDDYCYNIVKDPVHVHDFNATVLHCLGIDHKRLTFKFQGRDFRLTDVHGNVVKDLLV